MKKVTGLTFIIDLWAGWDVVVLGRLCAAFMWFDLISVDPFESGFPLALCHLDPVHNWWEFVGDFIRIEATGQELPSKFPCVHASPSSGLNKVVIPNLVPDLEFAVRCFLVVAGFLSLCAFVQVFLGKGKGGFEMLVSVRHTLVSCVCCSNIGLNWLVVQVWWQSHLSACHHLKWWEPRGFMWSCSDGHQDHRELNVPVLLIGSHVFLKDVNDCAVSSFILARWLRMVTDMEICLHAKHLL